MYCSSKGLYTTQNVHRIKRFRSDLSLPANLMKDDEHKLLLSALKQN